MIKNNKFFFENLKNIVFLGESASFNDLKEINDKAKLKSIFISSSHQSKKIKDLKFTVFNKIDNNFIKFLKKNNLVIENTLFISIGSRIIFTNDTIKNIFKNNIINVHPSMLPLGAGAGHFSWKILNNDRIEIQLLHLINEKIDSGPIIKYKKGIFPDYCKKPIDYEKYFLKNFLKFYSEFIKELKNNKKFNLMHQPDYLGYYLPKLNTKKNGFIDWELNSPEELYRFICAFDDPYDGASTFMNGNINKKVFLKDIYLHSGVLNSHSFMTGLVINKEESWIEVCTKNSAVLLIKKVFDDKGKNILKDIKKGDRFFTPNKFLEDAKLYRARYSSKGLTE